MRRYIVLRSSATRRGAAGVRGVDSGADVSIEAGEFSEKELRDIARDPKTRAVAPAMRTTLIEPLGEMIAAGRPENWALSAIRADHSKYTGEGVVVAVVDTGIDRSHPAFAGVAIEPRDFTGTGVGDGHGHGSHCAGTIFGRDVKGRRIGVARGVSRALDCKVLDKHGSGEAEMVFKAMQWALDERADVISMSLGFDFTGMVSDMVADNWPADLATSVALEAYRSNLRMFDAMMAVLKSRSSLGVSPIVIAATGNESRRDLKKDYRIAASLPAAADGVVSVGALSFDGAMFRAANFSNIWPTLSAPGVNIHSAWRDGQMKSCSGTSMACPHVAGVAALWWQRLRAEGRKPDAESVAARLRATARRERFAADCDEADIGEGLVTAP
ncbi:S8 family serine peptidase [Bradyrhizobium sp. U87765 SZCCT0131]|uniref:S8 family peptidase n=1 Tax=unclassified Bradyrhizobium TaxID=2631580 RepID=UPI001BAA1FBD|nr:MULTISPECIES: S8 family serine peptidase [unclassified Bradyrhizobium]MBR1220386.1 S8 family serine peptidase [Bradyrhizobium sp. U87765 SZCCT0131]MBR1263159.1 S8 family serine peptidase [Bradyrhizobium sp. U87765 SZCCT0134]MBR1306958.1 S8 family serine peptidase [Bradyrhizobium sp. U87765 SZCCT0110]MBR1323457.1 S8 family serine peptidase [Bradyrhizobium sp. U87765 SZCCT0109]MBR1345912.1 S8 family serine peptidase [Bradyrhizobium sp. U87765 SZCCT0048]